MNMTASELLKLFPEATGAASSQIKMEAVMTDSRTVCKHGLFVPIVGERFDGHEYLKNAINNGAVAALWQQDKPVPAFIPTEFPLYFVEDTITGLQQLARYYLEKVGPKVVAVTGSNGKTTTKDLLEAVLSSTFKTHKTQGNFNNHIGLPLTILQMDEQCEVVILEMGMSGFGEIRLLSELAQPDIAIITNIGDSHMEQLGSRAGIAQAKLEITEGLKPDGYLLCDGDEPLLAQFNHYPRTIKCGFNGDNDDRITSFSTNENGVDFKLNDRDSFHLPLLGTYNAKNATYAIVTARLFGIQQDLIQKSLAQAKLTGMRLERKTGLNGSLIINDAYNASPTSMKAAIETIKALPGFEKKVIVLGDMYELGTNEEALHRSVADVISEPVTHCLVIGEKGRWIGEGLKSQNLQHIELKLFETKEEAEPSIKQLLSPKTVVLFKASRGMKLETLIEQFVEKDRV